MLNEGLAESFLDTADSLINICKNRADPCEAHIRRAISSCYFGVFHALARSAANALAGADAEERPSKAWFEVYRGLAHGPCKKACAGADQIAFPDTILTFADNFAQLQDLRHKADYDPTWQPTIEDAESHVANAKRSIESLNSVRVVDQIAFATWVLITSPGAKAAREAVRQARPA